MWRSIRSSKKASDEQHTPATLATLLAALVLLSAPAPSQAYVILPDNMVSDTHLYYHSFLNLAAVSINESLSSMAYPSRNIQPFCLAYKTGYGWQCLVNPLVWTLTTHLSTSVYTRYTRVIAYRQYVCSGHTDMWSCVRDSVHWCTPQFFNTALANVSDIDLLVDSFDRCTTGYATWPALIDNDMDSGVAFLCPGSEMYETARCLYAEVLTLVNGLYPRPRWLCELIDCFDASTAPASTTPLGPRSSGSAYATLLKAGSLPSYIPTSLAAGEPFDVLGCVPKAWSNRTQPEILSGLEAAQKMYFEKPLAANLSHPAFGKCPQQEFWRVLQAQVTARQELRPSANLCNQQMEMYSLKDGCLLDVAAAAATTNDQLYQTLSTLNILCSQYTLNRTMCEQQGRLSATAEFSEHAFAVDPELLEALRSFEVSDLTAHAHSVVRARGSGMLRGGAVLLAAVLAAVVLA